MPKTRKVTEFARYNVSVLSETEKALRVAIRLPMVVDPKTGETELCMYREFIPKSAFHVEPDGSTYVASWVLAQLFMKERSNQEVVLKQYFKNPKTIQLTAEDKAEESAS